MFVNYAIVVHNNTFFSQSPRTFMGYVLTMLWRNLSIVFFYASELKAQGWSKHCSNHQAYRLVVSAPLNIMQHSILLKKSTVDTGPLNFLILRFSLSSCFKSFRQCPENKNFVVETPLGVSHSAAVADSQT